MGLLCFYTQRVTGKVRITEAVSHSDPPFYDYIELGNTGEKLPADISLWGLSEANTQRNQLVFPAGTIYGPGEHHSYDLLQAAGVRLGKTEDHLWLTALPKGALPFSVFF